MLPSMPTSAMHRMALWGLLQLFINGYVASRHHWSDLLATTGKTFSAVHAEWTVEVKPYDNEVTPHKIVVWTITFTAPELQGRFTFTTHGERVHSWTWYQLREPQPMLRSDRQIQRGRRASYEQTDVLVTMLRSALCHFLVQQQKKQSLTPPCVNVALRFPT
jgi:hypothetical protein